MVIPLSVREGPTYTLVQELLDFKHDICLVGAMSGICDHLHGFRIGQVERMVFVSSPDFRADTDTEVTWEELARQPIIVPAEGSDARRVVLSEFKARGLEPVIGAEVNNIEFAKELVRQKKGIALMFYPNVKEDIVTKKLKVIKVQGCDIRLGIDVLFNGELSLSPVTEELMKLIRERFNCKIQELGTVGATHQQA